ncbi:extracellular solute-binding protein [Paenibacillus sp. J5C_2022]|uniref:extracellular solute-binding protein n=1 Tax=Paenibacillus sp. J5C2022 TaxID=2977129 RepID=UPI0021D0CC42|nr:extracellular solute-binding protein [Paenibacillus sp. J5C2022]MCU6709579.1 extracellular solute-binding protein [Paenibacillus sp. J5C2022]
MKKTGYLLLTLLLSLSLVAACSSSNMNNEPSSGTAAPEGNKPAQTSDPAPAKSPKKRTFTMLVESHASWPYDPEWLVWDLIEEKTNVKLDVEVPAGKMNEALSLTIASGNLPDLMFMHSYETANKHGSDGAFANILDYIDVMPNLKRWMEEHPEASQAALSADGKMYMFPNEGISETNRMIWMYREDIFKEHGLQVPNSYDELYETLKHLKGLYPDSYPFVFRGGFSRLINIGAGFNTSHGVYYNDKAGEWSYGPTEDQYKTMLTYLNKFYEEGLIPPDFLTLDTKAWQDLISTDKSFITVDYIGRLDFFNVPLREQNASFNMKHMAPPAGPGGGQLNPHASALQAALAVASTSDQIEHIMAYMDFFFSEEGRDLASWGKEGVTYTVENGQKKIVDQYKDVSEFRKQTGISTNGTYAWFDYDAHLSLASDELRAAYDEARQYDSPIQPLPALTADEIDESSTLNDTVTKQTEQNVANFILGEQSFDRWDSYVKSMEDLGVGKLVDMHQTAHERAMNSVK